MFARASTSFFLAASLLIPVSAEAQSFDHMRCFKIKDSAKFEAQAILTAFQEQFGIDESCEIKGKGKMFCVPVQKTVIGYLDKSRDGIPPVALNGQDQVFDSICYKIKCPKRELSPELVTDQFGSRNVEKFKSAMLCAPAIKGLPTTTSSTTTTTVPACAPAEVDCNGVCADLATDPNNCGGCGDACQIGEICISSLCSPTCQAGLTDCNGVCRDLSTDENHCGACDNVCQAGETCVDGVCVLTCPPGQVTCSGLCRDLSTDESHCGACGNTCQAGETCVDGICETSCGNGTVDAGEDCDPGGAGDSSTWCCTSSCQYRPATYVCRAANGVCDVAEYCTGSSAACPGDSYSPSSVECRSSTDACDPAEVCSGTSPLCPSDLNNCCQAGLTNCGGVCRDLSTDPNHCGACGAVCAAGASCVAGQCLLSNGNPCASPSDCLSGFCADGVCCESACTGLCSSCDALGSEGLCTCYSSGMDPDNECPGASCDGACACLAP